MSTCCSSCTASPSPAVMLRVNFARQSSRVLRFEVLPFFATISACAVSFYSLFVIRSARAPLKPWLSLSQLPKSACTACVCVRVCLLAALIVAGEAQHVSVDGRRVRSLTTGIMRSRELCLQFSPECLCSQAVAEWEFGKSFRARLLFLDLALAGLAAPSDADWIAASFKHRLLAL
eukprot:m.88008 g.88008  ORF g.88008 m.88008 type:complete len:176 (-) comp8480_c0_seq2:299-826(-)